MQPAGSARNSDSIDFDAEPVFHSVGPGRSYRLADGVLRLSTNEPSLALRFEQIYGDCATDASPTLRCDATVQPDGASIVVTFDRQFADVARFVEFVFPERRFVHSGSTISSPDGALLARISPSGSLVVTQWPGWQSFVANVALNLLFRMQADLLFFHGAICDVNGSGVMLTGPKRSGKTTLSLALASRGHALLGDEIAAIRSDSWEAVPFERSLSIREGPRAARVDEALAEEPREVEVFPDGEPRIRIPSSRLFSVRPQAVPLRAAFFIGPFASTPRISALAPSPETLRFLQPLGCTLWNDGDRSLMTLLRFSHKTRCFQLEPGAPDATAEAIERLVEETWV